MNWGWAANAFPPCVWTKHSDVGWALLLPSFPLTGQACRFPQGWAPQSILSPHRCFLSTCLCREYLPRTGRAFWGPGCSDLETSCPHPAAVAAVRDPCSYQTFSLGVHPSASQTPAVHCECVLSFVVLNPLALPKGCSAGLASVGGLAACSATYRIKAKGKSRSGGSLHAKLFHGVVFDSVSFPTNLTKIASIYGSS